MTTPEPTVRPRATSYDPRTDAPWPYAAGLITLVVAGLATWLGFAAAAPPAAVPASAPAAEFSAERAQRHVYAMTRAPRPVGSAEHALVREYLLRELEALGLETEVQQTVGFNRLGGVTRAATVHNVLGRLPGHDPTGAVLLLSHYDGVPRSYGAGDAASGVAAILEALRALREGPRLRNDVLVLISDAEEVGLLGAQAFVDEHPWRERVSLVLNFEARGVRGAAQLFQTSAGNDRLIRAFAAAAPHAVGNSLAYEVYRRMPNDTDLSVFLRADPQVPGLNFAFVGGHTHYHTPLDRYEELSPRSLQHHGGYALALARQFGELDLRELAADRDRVFFDAPLVGMVHYPYGWALPLALAGAAWLIVLIVLGARRGLLRWGGLWRGASLTGFALVAGAFVGWGGWGALRALHPAYAAMAQGDTYNSLYYLVAIGAVVVALFVALFMVHRRRASAAELSIAPLAVFAGLALLLAARAPGASFVFAWPLLFGLASASLLLVWRERRDVPRAAALAVLAVPALVLLAPLIRGLQEALTMNLLGGAMVVLVLLCAALLPQVEVVGRHWRWAMPAVLALALGAFAAGTATARPTEARPLPNSLLYHLDADSGRARWVSQDAQPDEWTRGFLGDAPQRAALHGYWLTRPGMRALHAPAPLLALEPPVAEVLDEERGDGVRRVRLRVASRNGAERILLVLDDPTTRIAGLSLAGHETGPTIAPRGALLLYFAPPADGFEVTLSVASREPVPLRVIETVPGLPALPDGPLPPRPPHMISKPFIITDAAVVQRTFGI